MVGALCGSTQREPIVVGKPSTFMMDYLSNKYKRSTIFLFSVLLIPVISFPCLLAKLS